MKPYNENGLNELLAPLKLDPAIDASIKRASRKKKMAKLRNRAIKFSSVAALLILTLGIGISQLKHPVRPAKSITPTSSFEPSPIFSFIPDLSLQNAAANKYGQTINQSKSDKGITFTIEDAMVDNKRMLISYSISVDSGYEGLQNILVKDFTVKGSDGSLISSNERAYPLHLTYDKMLPYRKTDNTDHKGYIHVLDRRGFWSSTNSKNIYNMKIVSPDELSGDFKATRKAYGLIDISKTRDGSFSIPSQINLSFTKLAETYYTNDLESHPELFSQKSFVKANGREAMEISGNWDFNIELDKALMNTPSKQYKDIPFRVEDIGMDFKIESADISPLRTDIKFTWTDPSFQAMAWGAYLEDETGKRYYWFTGGSELSAAWLDFESCYFNDPKELYLVIERIGYAINTSNRNGDGIDKNVNIRVKIK